MLPVVEAPRRDSYDVVIIGGAIVGSSVAWWLAQNPDFDGSILVLDRDMTYANASTSHTNSCMRQQFSNPLNIGISQFGAEFVRDFRRYLGDDPEVPELAVEHFGYLYLADSEAGAAVLRHNQQTQIDHGASTELLSHDELGQRFSSYNLDDIICGTHNRVDEGYFDGGTMFDWLRRQARQLGAEYVEAEVVAIARTDSQVTSVALRSGARISCGVLINASGPRAAATAGLAGLDLPVEPRKRFTFIFQCAEALGERLPLTIDPSGVHVRADGDAYMAGCTPDPDPAVAFDDFAMDHDIFEAKVWPALAHRIPAFERIKVTSRWAGHYAYNTLDHNAIVGPHHEVDNFVFTCGFSGHGLQQSPAVGRAVSELITYGEYRTLDLSPLGYGRIVTGTPFVEDNVI